MNILRNIFLLTFGIFLFQSCNGDNKFHLNNPQVESAFSQKYPNATRITWEQKAEYLVADFIQAGKDSEAWFESNGTWRMTETDITFNELPHAVRAAFQASEYKSWRVEDVDKIERSGMETVYVLEVESGEREHDLYYSSDGVLIKIGTEKNNRDDNRHYLPQTSDNVASAYISKHYPQAKIIEIDYERQKGIVEADILDGKIHRELKFKADTGEWLSTKTELAVKDVPANIMAVLKKSEYSAYKIDDGIITKLPRATITFSNWNWNWARWKLM